MLIKIDVNAEQEAVVSGRELHEILEIGTQYTKWFERMKEYGFVENQDFATVSQKCLIANGGYQEKVDHAIKIAQSLGGNEYIRDVNNEIYTLLNMRMGVNLEQRRTNKRRRMADEGICKSRREKTSRLDVIAEDKKLIEGYVAIVKEMAVKYHAPKIVDDTWREE
ncbi:MAG: antA/AntB antirepressor family protein [Niameybacter sp.]